MFLPAAQGIVLPEQRVSTARREIGADHQPLSTGAQAFDIRVGNSDINGLQFGNPQVIFRR
jgi:hypothetical protein